MRDGPAGAHERRPCRQRRAPHLIFVVRAGRAKVQVSGPDEVSGTHTIRYLVHDRDKRFCPIFDEVFRAEGIEILRTPWRAPKANAYAERFIRTVRTECLDRVFLLGERHLRSVLGTYVEHYNRERPHRGLDLVAPEGAKDVSPLTIDDSVTHRDVLGGLIHEYFRRAA